MAAAKTKPEGNEGFVSSSKGITLSVISLAVWILTLILFEMTDAIAKGRVDYQVFCLFASFILSIATGLYISRLIYPPHDKWRTLAICLNILLIYSSANGIQAAHAAFAKSEAQKTNKAVEKLALFGLLDARPWLVDATSKQEIENLSAENKNLAAEVSKLKQLMVDNDKTGQVKDLVDTNQRLEIEITTLKTQVETLQQQLASENKDQLVQQLQNEIADLRNQLNHLQGNIATYNSIRNQWINKVNSDERFRGFVSKFRSGIAEYLGKDYYDQLFRFDLNGK